MERAAPPSYGDLRLVHLGQSLLVLRLVQSNLSYSAKFSLANAIGVGDPGSEASLDLRKIADALTEILRNEAFWTYYRQSGSFVESGRNVRIADNPPRTYLHPVELAL